MENQTKREGVRLGAWRPRNFFSGFTRCSQHVFLYLHATYSDERHGITFLYSLHRLRRHLLTYLSYKNFVRMLTRFAARFLP